MPLVIYDKLLKKRRTKIVATLGPASSNPQIIEQLINAGVNVFRLNMSHGEQETHEKTYHTVREAAKKSGLPIAILVDLCGPKIRTGKFIDGKITLNDGENVIVTVEDVLGKQGLIPSQYTSLCNDVIPGNRILLDDGVLELEVEKVSGKEITCRVIHGGVLKNHKGINLPGVNISAPSLTDKDKDDAKFALGLGADYIALSFVRHASDIEELRAIIKESGKTADIIAKIEKPEALDNIDQILDVTDGIMVARGDLGVEMPPEDVPMVQDQLIELARKKSKPVIVATQMLESMILNAKPTRAEVTDVSHAVNSFTDAVMLSAETATGQFPVETVKIMDRVIRRAEARLWKSGRWGSNTLASDSFQGVIANSTAKISLDLQAHAVMLIFPNRSSTLFVCSARPASPIVVIVDNEDEYERLSLLWGVIPVLNKDGGDPHEIALKTAKNLEIAAPGDCILLVGGFNDNPRLSVPSISVLTMS